MVFFDLLARLPLIRLKTPGRNMRDPTHRNGAADQEKGDIPGAVPTRAIPRIMNMGLLPGPVWSATSTLDYGLRWTTQRGPNYHFPQKESLLAMVTKPFALGGLRNFDPFCIPD